MPYPPVEDFELDFDIDRILRDPPVLRALTYLYVPNEYIARYSGYSIHSVLSWHQGRRHLPDDAVGVLVSLAGCVIQAIEETWDQESVRFPPATRDQMLIHLQAARALVALQRDITQGEDLPAAAADFFHEASKTPTSTRGD